MKRILQEAEEYLNPFRSEATARRRADWFIGFPVTMILGLFFSLMLADPWLVLIPVFALTALWLALILGFFIRSKFF